MLSTFFISVYLKRYYIIFYGRGYIIICVFFTHVSFERRVTYSTKICERRREPCAAAAAAVVVIITTIVIAESDNNKYIV